MCWFLYMCVSAVLQGRIKVGSFMKGMIPPRSFNCVDCQNATSFYVPVLELRTGKFIQRFTENNYLKDACYFNENALF